MHTHSSSTCTHLSEARLGGNLGTYKLQLRVIQPTCDHRVGIPAASFGNYGVFQFKLCFIDPPVYIGSLFAPSGIVAQNPN